MAERKSIGVVGVSGFLGRHLAALASSRGHSVTGFSRRAVQVGGCREIRPVRTDGSMSLAGLDAVVNLAGASVLGRWTPRKKRQIVESRVLPTRRIVDAIAVERMQGDLPSVLVNASGVGYYGDCGDRLIEEGAPRGSSFLAETCGLWESEAVRARDFGVCVSLLRIGFVLGRDGGAMPLLKRLFGMGLGGRLGNGRQYMSWIHVEDVVRIILLAVENGCVDGPLNAVGPEPVTNREFTKAVARASHRPALFPAPAFVLRGALGEMSSLLLESSRVVSKELAGFPYLFKTIESAMAEVFARGKTAA